MNDDWAALDERLRSILQLDVSPVAISFEDQVPAGVQPFDEPMSDPAPDGRRGRVPASCVFWMKATETTFTTVPADHGNCSVGRLTHGLADLDDVAGNDDVAALLGSGWISMDQVPEIPTLARRPEAITYGPLHETKRDPDVVFIRINPHQLMVLTDALPDVHIGGKPQCHIVPAAAEGGRVAVSFGCTLSRVRTGMADDEMTCAIPAKRLGEVVDRLTAARGIDDTVVGYATQDSARFA